MFPQVLWQKGNLGSHLETSALVLWSIGMWQAPHSGPRWQAFGKGLCVFSIKGQLLHPEGLKGVLWSVIGDHKLFSNTLGLPHWASHFPVGNVMLRISLHVPLEKGTKRSAWKSRDLFSTHMKSVWVTHGAIMPFSNSQGSAAAWSEEIPSTFFFAKESMATWWVVCFTTAATMKGQGWEQQKNLGKGWQFFFHKSRFTIPSRNAKTDTPTWGYQWQTRPSHGQSILCWIAREGKPDTCCLHSFLSSKQFLQTPWRGAR